MRGFWRCATLAVTAVLGTAAAPAERSASAAYLLLAPNGSTTTYLVDQGGNVVHDWKASAAPGHAAYLEADGHLLRAAYLSSSVFGGGGQGGRVEEYDWEGRLVWEWELATPLSHLHHDVRRMPNGHVLAVAWEWHSAAEAVAAGRPSASTPVSGVWADAVLEVDPATDKVVWSWHVWDHLLPPGASALANPGRVDPSAFATAESPDWTHVNAVDYSPELDQVVLSVRNHSEVWVVDHGTTAEETRGSTGGRRGRGGEVLYRWGNPAAWGASGERQVYFQHDAHWIPAGRPGAGHLLLFDNGDRKARPYSTAVELAPPLLADGTYERSPGSAYGPAAPAWRYVASPPESFWASHLSSARRLPSGNTLLCDGPAGELREVTPAGAVVWQYTLQADGGGAVSLFRAERYEASDPALAGRDLAPRGPLRVELDASRP